MNEQEDALQRLEEQKAINAYLRAHPLKASDKRSTTNGKVFCIACNSKMSVKKRRPVTTFTGEMNSVYTDRLLDFPQNEKEDLCDKCVETLRNSNAGGSGINNHEIPTMLHVIQTYDDSVSTYTDSMDAEMLSTENAYQGYGSYDALEGTGYKVRETDLFKGD